MKKAFTYFFSNERRAFILMSDATLLSVFRSKRLILLYSDSEVSFEFLGQSQYMNMSNESVFEFDTTFGLFVQSTSLTS